MRKSLLLVVVVVVVLLSFSASAATLRGIVRDPAGQPLAGASVSVDHAAAIVTGADGAFSLEVTAGRHTVAVSRSGFRTESRTIDSTAPLVIELQPQMADSIVVSGIRAGDVTPVTKSNVERPEIERDYHQEDIPLLLRDTPSVDSYTESGIGGSGYSYFTLRGVSPTRINFTLDGVPLADSEDMATYFADFPDLAQSLQSIQVQRGVGTSTVGSASFGGSVNLQSIDLSQERRIDARIAGGSFGTRFATVGYQSGFTPSGFALYSRLSLNETDGFRVHSGARQRNLFLSAVKRNERSQWRLTGFSGHEKQQMSFDATDAETLKTDLRANPLAPEDRDSFGYDLAQLQYLRELSASTSMTASTYYQRGYGWYRLYDDEATKQGLRQYGLDGMLVGTMLTMSWSHGPLSANYGLNVNDFRREHTRDLVGGARDYYNYGTKDEENVFAKVNYDLAKWHLYGDAQLRTASFHYHGDVAIDPIRWTFFNPKIGARYELTQASSLYASVGMSTREPARNDLFQGEDNATIAHDLHAVHPEHLRDFETGWNYRLGAVTIDANLYAMEFRDEIAATGELSDIGLALRRNVARSYRRGVELDARWNATARLRFRTVANASRNRIASWTQPYDVYDANGNWLETRLLVHRNVEPLLTPPLLFSQAVEYAASTRLDLGAVARYVARSFLDNTSNREFTAPAFTVVDATAAFTLGSAAKLTLQVNNLFNRRDVFPSGYSYLTMDPAGNIGGTRYFYPQATRNFVLMIDARL